MKNKDILSGRVVKASRLRRKMVTFEEHCFDDVMTSVNHELFSLDLAIVFNVIQCWKEICIAIHLNTSNEVLYYYF